MTGLRAARRRDEGGFTLIETMLVVVISALIMVPLLGWGLLASRQQVDTQNRNTDGASIGLFRTTFMRDVPSATRADSGAVANGTDCSGGDGAATTPEETVLRLRGDGGTWISYTATTSSDGEGTSIWRRECGGGGPPEAIELVQRVQPGSVVTTCSPRQNAPATDCGRINARFTTVDAELVSMTASVRVNAVAVGAPAGPSYVSPDVIISVSPVEVFRGDDVVFDASASVDPRGGDLDFLWEFGDGTTSTDAVVTKSFDMLGEFSAVLTATNSDGTPSSDFARIEVRNRPPTAVISAPPDGLETFRCTNVGFAAVGSNDSGDSAFGGTVASYEWEYGDGGTSTRTSPGTHTRQYTQLSPNGGDDPFQVRLRVVDNDGGESTLATRSVRVVNRPPATPTITANGLSGEVIGNKPLSVSFASSVSDPDGSCDTLSYEWDFGDGRTSTEANPTITYSAGASYTVRLTVTDDAGESRTSDPITVTLNSVPTAAFNLSTTNVRTGVPVNFTSTSTDDETPITGLDHLWDFPNGDPTSSETRNPSGVRFTDNVGSGDTFTNAAYVVNLTVTDPQGAQSTTQRMINVTGAPAPGGLNHSGSSVCVNNHWFWGCREWRYTNTISWNAVSAVDRYQVHLRWRNCFIFCGSWNDRYLETTASPLNLINYERGDGDVTIRVRARDSYSGKWGAWSGEITRDFYG